MKPLLHISGLLLLGALCGLCDNRAGTPPKAPADAPNAGVATKGGGQIINPNHPFAAMLRMTPEQRERVLEKYPPALQDRARMFLDRFDKLPKEQQERQIRRLEWFQQQPPEKQAEVRTLMKSLNQLPPARRTAVGQALTLLQRTPDNQRQDILGRPAFKARFSPDEQKIIAGLMDILVPPF